MVTSLVRIALKSIMQASAFSSGMVSLNFSLIVNFSRKTKIILANKSVSAKCSSSNENKLADGSRSKKCTAANAHFKHKLEMKKVEKKKIKNDGKPPKFKYVPTDPMCTEGADGSIAPWLQLDNWESDGYVNCYCKGTFLFV